jgi:F-type H+-transporting ATPase subunit b
MNNTIRIAIVMLALAFAGVLAAQEHGAAPAQPEPQQNAVHENATQKNPAHETTATPTEGAEHHAAAGGHKEEGAEGEEDEHDALKHSASVKWIGSKLGISDGAAYWVFVILNFAVLAGAIGWALKSKLPAVFRSRTESIQKGIEEARKASAEASARLAEIEARLSKLDDEVAEIRTAAAADFSAEEQRIKQAAEQDARNVVESAEQEIATAARTAQRELKAYAADLAVGIAQKKITVDAATDQQLVSGFVAGLGKEGK